MVIRAVELEQPAIALTDHGNLHGAIDFFQAAKKNAIKPIIGVEGYVADGPRDERNPQKRSPCGKCCGLTVYRYPNIS